jgi:hypothetical protein
MRIRLLCTINNIGYRKEVELDYLPQVGDMLTVWKRVFKNRSRKPANTGVTVCVVSRRWDTRDSGVELVCKIDPMYRPSLIEVGFVE